jgi:hypothetical protein
MVVPNTGETQLGTGFKHIFTARLKDFRKLSTISGESIIVRDGQILEFRALRPLVSTILY